MFADSILERKPKSLATLPTTPLLLLLLLFKEGLEGMRYEILFVMLEVTLIKAF